MIENLPTARGLKDLFNPCGYLLPNQTVLLIPRLNESDESEGRQERAGKTSGEWVPRGSFFDLLIQR